LHIRFNHTVLSVKPQQPSGWRVVYGDASGAEHVETFDAVMVANGHHWNPKYPEFEGHFDGKLIHSHDFKGVTEEWWNKSVLIVGAGNSACDVAVETARIAGKVCMSMRSPNSSSASPPRTTIGFRASSNPTRSRCFSGFCRVRIAITACR
jgi:cation diffusion facilitator CzcD-associated flavoprotein CzcO